MISLSETGVPAPYSSSIASVLGNLPVVIAVVDANQQVVFGREELLHFAGIETNESTAAGPGDIIRCVRAESGPSGCGSADDCKLCGAFQAMRESRLHHASVTKEFRIEHVRGQVVDNIDLVITAIPHQVDEQEYTLIALLDAGGEKRRKALERLFFHDVLNTAGGLAGLTRLLRESKSESSLKDMLQTLEYSAKCLLDEIESHRQLTMAESGELVATMEQVVSVTIIHRAVDLAKYHDVADGREILCAPEAESFVLETDPILLRRVLLNLAKNALEATEPGGRVTLSSSRDGGRALFTVHNEGYIKPEVQSQLFHRSFSTKGAGRGIGSYSVRILTERYLAGNVRFESTERDGTTFTVALP